MISGDEVAEAVGVDAEAEDAAPVAGADISQVPSCWFLDLEEAICRTLAADEACFKGFRVREDAGARVGVLVDDDAGVASAAAAAGVVSDDGLSVRHLTVTRPEGSDRNHSERCFIRSVCFWWT